MARIELTASAVTWSDFEACAPNVSHLPDGLQFTFDRTQYESAIADVLNIEPTTWAEEVTDD